MEDKYWATEDGSDLVQKLRDKRKEFVEYFKATVLYPKVQRSYRYYHDLFYEEGYAGDAIKLTGDELEERRVAANQYRATLNLLKTYVTAQRPEWDSIAISSDYTALEGAKLSNELLDSYMLDPETHVEQALGQAVEDGLVLSAGYVWNLWDQSFGAEVSGDVKRAVVNYAGEFRFLNPSILDVSYDRCVREFKDSNWVHVRRRENKWDLAAQYPELREEILNLETDEDETNELEYLELRSPEIKEEDHVWVFYFYHKRTPAMPLGRFVRYVGEHILADEDLVEKVIPVHRIVPAQYLLSCFGFTPGFSMQPAQEALNALLSIILTNQNALGNNKIWTKAGEPINRADLEPGISVIQTNTPPQSLNFLQSAPELFKSVELYNLVIEQLSGVNATSRGQAPPNLKSGAALAMMDSRTLQSVSDLVTNYRSLQCDVGTSLIRTLATRVEEPRTIAILGVNSVRFMPEFRGEMLADVQKVRVTTGNPLMSTIAGKTNMAEFLAQTGLIKTPEELITVVQTGNLDRLTEHNESQLRASQAENDGLLRSEDPAMLLIDNHRFHILKHVSILDDPKVRSDPNIGQKTMAHIGEHAQALMDPMVQQLQILLGYQLPMAPGGPNPPPGAGQATASAPVGSPGQGPAKKEETPDAVDQRVQDAKAAAGQ